MNNIVNAKVVEEERPVWPRYIVQAMFDDGFCQHGVAGDIQTAMNVRNRVSKLPARIIDTAPEPSPAMSPQVRELVAAATSLLELSTPDTWGRMIDALKPFANIR